MSSLQIGVIGDRDPAFEPHVATDDALVHSSTALGLSVSVTWLPTNELADAPSVAASYDGLWCAPGSPYRSLEGALGAVAYARTSGVPLLGTCGGFQHVVLEYARNVLGMQDAAHAEYDPYASTLFVDVLACSLAGRTMEVALAQDSQVADLYGATSTRERYYCNFGLAPGRGELLDAGGLRVVGRDQDAEARVVELATHPFFIATLFVPQASSTPSAPHPLVSGFLGAVALASDAGRRHRQRA